MAWPVVAPAQPAPPLIISRTVPGHAIKISINADRGDASIYVDGKFLGREDDQYSPDFFGPFDIGPASVELIQFYAGGNACETVYRALTLPKSPTGKVSLSDEIGDCYPATNMSSDGHAVILAVPALGNGNGQEIYRLDAKGLHVQTTPTVLSGPAYMPNLDMAKLVLPHETPDVFTLRAPAERIHQLVGDAVYQDLLFGELGFKFIAIGAFAVGMIGGPQMPDYDQAVLVFDHHGHVWVETDRFVGDNGGTQITWYGDPPAAARDAFTAYENLPGSSK